MKGNTQRGKTFARKLRKSETDAECKIWQQLRSAAHTRVLAVRGVLPDPDAHRAEIWPLFEQTYGAGQAKRWWAYWRVFYMACAELWGYKEGNEWIVSHYRFRKPEPGSA